MHARATDVYKRQAQNMAQAHLSPSEAGLLCSLESVFCALFSVAFFGEVLLSLIHI